MVQTLHGTMNKKRLLKIAKWLEQPQEQLAHPIWNYLHVNHYLLNEAIYSRTQKQKNYCMMGCGSVGCAMGEFPAIWPKHWSWTKVSIERIDKRTAWTLQEEISAWLDISVNESMYLFIPSQVLYDIEGKELDFVSPSNNASKNQVAKHIRNFVKLKEKGII